MCLVDPFSEIVAADARLETVDDFGAEGFAGGWRRVRTGLWPGLGLFAGHDLWLNLGPCARFWRGRRLDCWLDWYALDFRLYCWMLLGYWMLLDCWLLNFWL